MTAQTNDALRPLQPGDAVTAGQALFTMAGGNGYIVRAQVDEQDIINVRLGMPVIVTGEDFPGKTIHGHVATIAPIATKSTDATSTAKQVLTTIQLDQNPPFLRDGMSADVDILTTSIPHSIVDSQRRNHERGGQVVRLRRARRHGAQAVHRDREGGRHANLGEVRSRRRRYDRRRRSR